MDFPDQPVIETASVNRKGNGQSRDTALIPPTVTGGFREQVWGSTLMEFSGSLASCPRWQQVTDSRSDCRCGAESRGMHWPERARSRRSGSLYCTHTACGGLSSEPAIGANPRLSDKKRPRRIKL